MIERGHIKRLFIMSMSLMVLLQPWQADAMSNDTEQEIQPVEIAVEQQENQESSQIEETETPKPWENTYITDSTVINDKLKYQKREPDRLKTIGNGKLITLYDNGIPEGVVENLQYTKYSVGTHYFLNMGSVVNVREKPEFTAKKLVKKWKYEKMSIDAVVQGEYSSKSKTDLWYRVYWEENETVRYGYVFANVVTKREFQLDKMIKAAERLKDDVDQNQTAYIANYKNNNGWAPRFKGAQEDDYGVKREQSAPAYFHELEETEFRYMIDGTLVSIQNETDEYYQVTAVAYEGMYFVPKKYVVLKNSIEKLEKIIIVDRNNQNEIVMEHLDGNWHLISKMFATTGVKATHKEETALGNFMAIDRKSKFLYLDDVTEEISGYAPFAVRFNGGAYVHGVPVNYKMVKKTRIITPAVLDEWGYVTIPAVTEEVVVDRVDPGHAEYLSTIGTIPRSHKCVRNYTSHAKFLYDWVEIGKTAVVVIE